MLPVVSCPGSALRRLAALAGLAALGLASGCGGGRDDGGALLDGAAGRTPELILDLSPVSGRDELVVTVRVTGPPAAAVKELRVARSWADTRAVDVVRDVEVNDARGPMR